MNVALTLPVRHDLPHWPSQEDVLTDKMRRRVGNRVRNLRIDRSDPMGVIIRGESASFYGKQLAQQAVMELVDEPILANEIVVD